MYIIAGNLLKRLGVTFLVILLGLALLQKILTDTPGAGVVALAVLMLASPAAYVLRRSCRAKPARRPQRQGRERTRAGL